jgi:uncharacterized ion transporter superfamily protein YfcC
MNLFKYSLILLPVNAYATTGLSAISGLFFLMLAVPGFFGSLVLFVVLYKNFIKSIKAKNAFIHKKDDGADTEALKEAEINWKNKRRSLFETFIIFICTVLFTIYIFYAFS